MISVKSRAYWLGCSDCEKLVGNWNTATWETWWMEKIGLGGVDKFRNKYTCAGTNYEHRILEMFGSHITMDHQIKNEILHVRANYDGIDFTLDPPKIIEVKTFNEEKEFKVSKTYWKQAQMEMWVLGTDNLIIAAYPLNEENYNNYWLDLDPDKLQIHKVERDDKFIYDELVPRIEILSDCLEQGKWPERTKHE